MRQILIIHGGTSYSSRDGYLNNLKSMQIDYDRMRPRKSWKLWLAEQLPDDDVLTPSMPCADNAVYDEWVLMFEKILPSLTGDVRLIGHSLGAMFLAKYLQQNPLQHKATQIILIAGGYNDDSLEDLGSFGVKSATNLPQSSDDIHLLHSTDDPVVPYTELAKFQADLPQATVHTFTNKAHFNDTEFPELVEILK